MIRLRPNTAPLNWAACFWLGFAMLFGLACPEPPTSEDPGETPARDKRASGINSASPPIVLITIDTLRRDHLSLYGHFQETSPNLEAFAKEAVVFTNAWATAGATLPSHTSLLTGTYPTQHGAARNRIPFESRPGLRSVAELLKQSGYKTAGFVSATPLKSWSGINAGFDVFDEPKKSTRDCAFTVDRVKQWLQEDAGEQFFLWAHLWDPHDPNVPNSFYSGFAGDPRYEALVDARLVNPSALPGLESHIIENFFDPTQSIDRAAVADLLARYDANVRQADQCAQDIFETLQKIGVYDAAIIVVGGDHGQSLGQHDWLGHVTVTEVNLAVPLIMRFPPGMVEPKTIKRVVSNVDVMTTVLSRFKSSAGEALAAQAAGEDLLSGHYTRNNAAAVQLHPDDIHLTLRQGSFKLTKKNSDLTLHDLAADPLEIRDIAGLEPGKVNALYKDLMSSVGEQAQKAPEDLPDTVREELEALGYIVD